MFCAGSRDENDPGADAKRPAGRERTPQEPRDHAKDHETQGLWSHLHAVPIIISLNAQPLSFPPETLVIPPHLPTLDHLSKKFKI